MAWEEAPEYTSYDQVPFYRKRWFFVLTILFFIPAGLAIAFTGEVYLLKDGTVMKYPQSQRMMIAVAWTILLCVNVLRAFMH